MFTMTKTCGNCGHSKPYKMIDDVARRRGWRLLDMLTLWQTYDKLW